MVTTHNGKMTTLSQMRFKLNIDIGATALCLFYGRDIYDTNDDTIRLTTPDVLSAHVTNSLHQIGGGWTAARRSDFVGVIQRGELNCFLLLDDCGDVTLGRNAAQIQRNLELIKELADGSPAVTIVRAVGFGKDDLTGSLLIPMNRLNVKQNVTALTGSGMISILGNHINILTHTGSNADGSPPIEIYAMEARLNAKEFQRIDTVKCAGRTHVMEWYDGVGVHGSMWGVFIPPGFSLVKDRPMGTLWDKRLVGVTVHASRTLMSRHIHKALIHPFMFTKDDFGDQCRDIVSTSEGCSYASLHNIMRLVHLALCDKVVDTTIPYQGNVVSFAAHVRNMTQYLASEKLRRRLYTKYETLMMTLETLQARFRAPMKHNAGLLFESGHDHTDNTPFKLAMRNLATTLTSWAKDMNLDIPRGTKGDIINHLHTYPGPPSDVLDTGVHYVGSDKQYKCVPFRVTHRMIANSSLISWSHVPDALSAPSSSVSLVPPSPTVPNG
jgi:hypothetical protein